MFEIYLVVMNYTVEFLNLQFFRFLNLNRLNKIVIFNKLITYSTKYHLKFYAILSKMLALKKNILLCKKLK